MKKITLLLLTSFLSIANAGGNSGTTTNTETTFNCVHEHIAISKYDGIVILDREIYGSIDSFDEECPIYIENAPDNEDLPDDRLSSVIWEGEEFDRGYPQLQQAHPAEYYRKHDPKLPTCRFALDPIDF